MHLQEGPDVQHQLQRHGSADIAGQGVLQHSQRAHDGKEGVQIIECLGGRGIHRQQLADQAIRDLPEDLLSFLEPGAGAALNPCQQVGEVDIRPAYLFGKVNAIAVAVRLDACVQQCLGVGSARLACS